MANEKISQMPAISSFATGDLLPIVDVSEISTSDQNKSVTFGELFRNVLGGSASDPSIAFTGDQNTGIYSPGADSLGLVTGGSARLSIDSSGNISATGTLNVTGAITGGSLIPSGSSVPTNGIYLPSANTVAVATNGTGRVFVNASGNLGVGVSSPAEKLQLADGNIYLGTGDRIVYNGGASGNLTFQTGTLGNLIFNTQAGSERLRITSAGLVGIGTSIPFTTIHSAKNVTGGSPATSGSTDANVIARFQGGSVGFDLGATASGPQWIQPRNVNDFSVNYGLLLCPNGGNVGIGDTGPDSTLTVKAASGVTPFKVSGPSSEFAKIDSSGRLLVGTSSALGGTVSIAGGGLYLSANDSSAEMQLTRASANSGSPFYLFNKARGTYASPTVVSDGDICGTINFRGHDGSAYIAGASISAVVDGTPGANDMPGRLVFSTTADGASSPTERMRITNGGAVLIGATSQPIPSSSSDVGVSIGESTGYVIFSRSGGNALNICRQTNDGPLIAFHQGGTEEGNISVSGTTVSYNGAHLSRWSQLPGGAERTEILRGSVLSNIDEMCDWPNEENEQLNRMKVSDVEGDKNVSGVFQAWDDDDDTFTNDFYCAMTGDFIIRIAEGVTVERGDLLMSAGDGTAKPQDDDIIRSKTIAKVTSTNVSCTYPDGSYCVPCVLMAC